MAITTLLAAATGAATSSDVTLDDGYMATLSATGQGVVYVEPKLSSGYANGEAFGGAGKRTVQIRGPITFRARRLADSSAGVDIEKV